MTKIETEIVIKKTKEAIMSLFKDIEKFPEFMKFVKEIKLIENSDSRVLSKWNIDLAGAQVNWKQEDIFDEDRSKIKFRMIQGDFKSYEGEWRLNSIPGGTRVCLKATFDWGIPVLEPHVKNTLERKAKIALLGMLKAIKKRSEE